MSIPVAILAGGLGKRIWPLTQAVPKALVEINGEPFIAHQLRLLRASGIERVVLCTGYRGELLRDFVGDGRQFGLRVDCSEDGPTPRGTAGAIQHSLPLLGEAFFVLYGDSYLPCDYRAVEQAFWNAGKEALMTVFRNEDRWDSSNVEYANGRVLAYNKQVHTARMRYIDYGLGVFRRSAFDGIPTDAAHDLAALYGELAARGELAGLEVHDRFYEIGSFEGIRDLSQMLAAKAGTRSLQV